MSGTPKHAGARPPEPAGRPAASGDGLDEPDGPPDFEPELASPIPPEPVAGSLFDLDLPSAGDLNRVPTLDIELGEVPDSDPPDDSADAAGSEMLQLPEAPASRSDGPERRVSLPPQERARNLEEQHEQRRRRTIDRLLTLRDAFRLMAHLDVPEAERKATGRMLVGLDRELGVAAGLSVIKDPANALQTASKDQLDIAERQISVLEDRMLALDELVPPEIFHSRVEARKQSKKGIARYARLLASRRMSAGQRRDRFEWIATHLLTARAGNGTLMMLPPDRARSVLQHMIGGLPRKIREHELEEALGYLNEALDRLTRLKSHDELFESGLYLDVHGYKVSMREQLLSPEFLYLSVTLNAALHNRVEEWVADRERLHDSNQLTSEGTPREQIMRRLRAQEEEVDASFGVRRRSLARVDALRPESNRPAPLIESERPPQRRRRDMSFAFDRSIAVLVITTLVTLGAGAFVLHSTGVVGKTAVAALDSKGLARFSPLLIRGMIVGKGEARKLKGWVQRNRWTALDARRRREAADHLASTLSAAGVRDAQVYLLSGAEPVIELVGGTVTEVQGGKL